MLSNGHIKLMCEGQFSHCSLYKDNLSVSNEAFHKLSMVPNSSRIKTLTRTLNSEFEIRNAPNGVGVQQSLRARIMIRVTQLIEKGPKMKVMFQTQ